MPAVPHDISSHRHAIRLLAGAACVGALAALAAFSACADAAEGATPLSTTASAPAKPKPDLSGRPRVGNASFYSHKFAGRKMADGNRMDPQDDNAASRTLPLGTTAKVTSLETGKSAVVTIQDRGPHVKSRIVDLSPATARKIGLTPSHGLAKVEVAPIAVPLPDGRVKPGAAAMGAKRSRLGGESDGDRRSGRSFAQVHRGEAD